MALIVFLRGVNVGGHRILRPSMLARQLAAFDVVSVGAAGTFVVRKPGSRTRFLAALRGQLPFEATVAVCEARELIQLEAEDPFGTDPPAPDVVRFLSILSEPRRRRIPLPLSFPEDGAWLLQIIGARDQFVYGRYRRHMKAMGYLNQVDSLFGVPATTRNWNTIRSVLRVLRSGASAAESR